MAQHRVNFGVIGADHIHIYRMVEEMLASGGVFRGWWTRDKPESSGAGGFKGAWSRDERDAAGAARKPFNGAQRLADYRTLLDDPDIELILVGAVPGERAELSIEAMEAGKDVVTDKPGVTTLQDLERLRLTASATGRFWSVNFSERYLIRATIKAAEIIGQGVIGEVIHTVGLGPHRGMLDRRRPWFFERASGGGILCDLASHQIDNFLFFTGSRHPRVVAASVGNFTRPEFPQFEDFGEVLLQGERASGYARVDWLTPDAQPYSSDSRLTILGTRGVIEIRKYVDLGGRPGGDHLFVVHGGECERIDCSHVPLRYFADISNDVRERTSTAESPSHSFLVSELTLRAQVNALQRGYLAGPVG